MKVDITTQDMEEEFKKLHGIFQKLGELHSHLKKFKGTVPPQYSHDAKKLLEVWKFQTHFVYSSLTPQFQQPFSQMQTHVSGFLIDFYLNGILH
jgi:hypothetical protein